MAASDPTGNPTSNEPPRRILLDKLTPAERAIYDAVQAVESVGADVRLTDAVVLLQAARGSVADFVDGVDPARRAVFDRRAIANDITIEMVDAASLDGIAFTDEQRGFVVQALEDAVQETLNRVAGFR